MQRRTPLRRAGYVGEDKLPMTIPTTSYESIAQSYRSAIDWIEALGVQVGSGRTTHYRKVIEYWREAYKYASEEEAKKSFPDFVSSVFELTDFIDIYEAFKNESHENLAGIRGKLIKGVNGPVNSVDEAPKSSDARNFVFEALMAARAHRPNSGVTAILDAESDTGVSLANKKLWIECKRITSNKKIESNIRDATNQLEKRLKKKTGVGHRGIVAIDATKLLNPKDQLYVQSNDQMLLRSVDKMMEQFIDENSEQWEKVYVKKNKKIIGTIIRFSFMSTSQSRNLLVRTGQWAVNPRRNSKPSDVALLQSLACSIKHVA